MTEDEALALYAGWPDAAIARDIRTLESMLTRPGLSAVHREVAAISLEAAYAELDRRRAA